MVFGMQMVDVFGAGPLAGNPLAVITGAGALSTEDMQRLTRWFNLSETAFLLPPMHLQADYRVRIFTLDREMPFAGHPTLGSCHAWLSGCLQAAWSAAAISPLRAAAVGATGACMSPATRAAGFGWGAIRALRSKVGCMGLARRRTRRCTRVRLNGISIFIR
ncbi:PhzF family phenazine biosynthesis protein [Serratia marcescens]|uniref:PhzF family phenazine biosynthesis protein n=1 Tax=Serratia marcescens TaxID=615 RepID=UPI000A6A481C